MLTSVRTSLSAAIDPLRRLLTSEKVRAQNHENGFLKGCKGVIHVGANTGQERKVYDRLGLNVIWVEPIPEVFAQLVENIAAYPKQRAIEALITQRDGDYLTLNVASNGGASSSILDLHEHKDVWPDVSYVRSVDLVSSTLTTSLGRANVDWNQFDVLVMDTQGAELLVLKGAVDLLPRFKFIKTEVADFEAYKNCTQGDEMETFLGQHSFVVARRDVFASRAGGGKYYDMLFKRVG